MGRAFPGSCCLDDDLVAGVGLPGEVQRPAEVGVGQGEGIIAVLHGLGQQFVDVGCAQAEGVEALGMELDVAAGCGGSRR